MTDAKFTEGPIVDLWLVVTITLTISLRHYLPVANFEDLALLYCRRTC